MEWLAYADEADLLNVCIFGCRAKDWREANPELAKKGENIRDFASISELTVLANLESLNSTYIAEGIIKEGRFQKLQEHAKRQIKILIQHSSLQLPPQ